MTKESVFRRVNLIVNILIIVVAIFASIVFVREFLGEKKAHRNNNFSDSGKLEVGLPFSLKGIDWSESEQSIVIALSPTCGYCTASAPFYRRLIENLQGGRSSVRVIAIFSEPVEAGQRYLASLDLHVDKIVEMPIQSLGISGTPSLIIVDNKGVLKNIWNGKLSSKKESEVLNYLNIQNTNFTEEEKVEGIINRIELEKLLASNDGLVLLDVRDRSEYAKDHLQNAKNIPFDELNSRAIDEISLSSKIVVYCDCPENTVSESARKLLYEKGFKKIHILEK